MSSNSLKVDIMNNLLIVLAQIHPYRQWWDMWESLGLAWLAVILMIIGGILMIGLSLYISHFMHKDAIKRNIPYPELWLFIGLAMNVFGLIIYLLNRGNYQQKRDNIS